MQKFFTLPFWSYAFRPFYALAAAWGAVAVFLWAMGFQGTAQLPDFWWHAREMVWGYTGAVIVGFLLTAVATWTRRPPLKGPSLGLLVLLWLMSRLGMYLPDGLWVSMTGGFFFYLAAAVFFAQPVLKTANIRNYAPVFALLLFGLAGVLFDMTVLTGFADVLREALFAGVLMAAAFIGLIGMRVIPFFTARRLGTKQVPTPLWLMQTTLWLPVLAAVCVLFGGIPALTVFILLAVSGCLNLFQLSRSWHKGVWGEPLLWVLFLGYSFTALGMIAFGAAHAFAPQWESAALHLVTVGGIGLMTLGMMARTALGHTGRPLKLSRPLPLAFWLMAAAALLRPLASLTLHPAFYYIGRHGSGTLFALALILFLYRYLPYLWQEEYKPDNQVLNIIR